MTSRERMQQRAERMKQRGEETVTFRMAELWEALGWAQAGPAQRLTEIISDRVGFVPFPFARCPQCTEPLPEFMIDRAECPDCGWHE